MGKKVTVDVTLTVGVAGAAMAQTVSGPDLSSITSAVVTDTVSAGVVSMGVVKVAPNMAKRAVNKLVGSFR